MSFKISTVLSCQHDRVGRAKQFNVIFLFVVSRKEVMCEKIPWEMASCYLPI